MPPSYFPLRWESTGDQWWYASPIDLAAANGHYDLVRELLHFDTNLLIKLTSLRRIRRLETVWDDEEQFVDVAKNRSKVAKKLLLEGEPKNGHGDGHNSLIRAGYGGWLLYTAASAGDLEFVKQLLKRDPLLVFGEGEYGVTDILYAAARSKNSEVFQVLVDFSLWSKVENVGSVFKLEMMNRAVHAAARGGSLEILKQFVEDCGDVLMYRDVQGNSLLHSASGRGQTQVVKYLLESHDIINSTDGQGNTALHVAAYNGHLPVVELLISSSPALITSTNNYGDTFLHTAVAGFKTPGFRRVDQQIDLMKHLVSGKIVNIEDIINVKNNDGRTALHIAIIENIHLDLVELLMTVRYIDLNIRDVDRMTPLDLLKQQPISASSEILIKRLISAGGISNYNDYMARTALASHLRTHGLGGSPGTSFRVPDSEIIFYICADNDRESSMYSGELSHVGSPVRSNSGSNNWEHGSSAARRLKLLFKWAQRKKDNDQDSVDSFHLKKVNLENRPVSIRERYMKSSLSNSKRVFGPSPSTKKKFSAGLSHGVLQVRSPSSQFSGSSWSSGSGDDDDELRPANVRTKNYSSGPLDNHGRPKSMIRPTMDGTKNYVRSSSGPLDSHGKPKFHRRQSSLSKVLMNEVFCFGSQGIAVEDSVKRPNPSKLR
ncbi:putative ankyrin repeat-containing domain-containing protein [Helianthus annuus]|uniref:Ankyrin repeat-containing domain-containing protein n=2 Tax=Helianthus annuus TaxID=4232 RepID=A0A9K3IBD6_HELAN|nr:serine/threonine-protein phosphatase 6 regulatory ankyrin repeat subunit B [Helianthus annuus]KAF5793667.1 putative ankyrin repeat-containing domain-containing protein [Helianthus annuus]KAJ0544937.1 putative ankyrin repeat-containing domain-containing protein [Helianthus annuus]KAJ0551996.1 putative ankyrin repeat-containing domain-containing protein [Helianthus annuus]KAJ0717700.1 putative ankyrin repeat-containing domain-containing protein [Helianthus annuus]KAJ0720913.1 putative ankyrin